MEYGLVDYDVQDIRNNMSVYRTIYKHLSKVSLRYTDSVYLVNLAHMSRVDRAMQDINSDLKVSGKQIVDFHVTRIAPESSDEIRGRSQTALANLICGIASRLNNAIDKMEADLGEHHASIDINKWASARRARIVGAARELREARGLALIFSLEQNVAVAVEATDKVVAAARLAAGILK